MIINTGQRTDIPAFFSTWFINRLKKGFVCVRNPYNYHQVNKYILSPEIVDAFAFCTKNPEPMFNYMNLLKEYGQYWFVTITPYGKDIEPNVPEKKTILESFKKLSDLVGVNSVRWRYDPIFISDRYNVNYHIFAFEQMAKILKGYTDVVIISFIDMYKKVLRNFPEARRVSREDRIVLGKEIIRIAKENGMTVRTCGEGDVLVPYGALANGCQTINTFEKAINCRLDVPICKSNRESCDCYLTYDIGAYDTCMHLCKYCYANSDNRAIYDNINMHNPESPFLVGDYSDGDLIHTVNEKSWKNQQISIFDII